MAGRGIRVEQTIEKDLPEETDYLRRYDKLRALIEAIVEMPERTVDLLFRMLRQNGGRLSKRACENEFDQLTTEEVSQIESAYARAFASADGETTHGP
ncbi:MAG: hypothetical protein SFW09_07445 [Hyphomicrobiaceae bacterium]|nr:hypothetical protein [Hyphomicrobiaceae bacterium]